MPLGQNCTSSCRTKDHESFGACLRAKNLKVGWCRSADGHDFTANKQADRSLDAYQAARAQGIQPSSTRREDVERAVKISELSGAAWDAGASQV